MAARNFGLLIDRRVRDTACIQKETRVSRLARGAVRPSSVSHFRWGGSNIPIFCDAVPVNPGDIIVTDNDGWPRSRSPALMIGFGAHWIQRPVKLSRTPFIQCINSHVHFWRAVAEHADPGTRQDSNPHNYRLRRSKRFAGGEKQSVGRVSKAGRCAGGISLRCRDRRARMGCF
jgi:hypothetical protein